MTDVPHVKLSWMGQGGLGYCLKRNLSNKYPFPRLLIYGYVTCNLSYVHIIKLCQNYSFKISLIKFFQIYKKILNMLWFCLVRDQSLNSEPKESLKLI